MKIKDGFLLRRVAGENVALPVSDALDQNQMITLNDTGAFLWELMQSETDADTLAAALRTKYGVDDGTARYAVDVFVKKLSGYGFLE